MLRSLGHSLMVGLLMVGCGDSGSTNSGTGGGTNANAGRGGSSKALTGGAANLAGAGGTRASITTSTYAGTTAGTAATVAGSGAVMNVAGSAGAFGGLAGTNSTGGISVAGQFANAGSTTGGAVASGGAAIATGGTSTLSGGSGTAGSLGIAGNAGSSAGSSGTGASSMGGSPAAAGSGALGDAGNASSAGAGGVGVVWLIADSAPCGIPAGTPPSNQLLDLGHSTEVDFLQVAGDRVLSKDTSGHWVLWNSTTRNQVLSGDLDEPSSFIDLRGTAMAVATAGTIHLFDAATGSPLGTVTDGSSTFGLASHGEYLWGSSAAGLKAWSTSGTPLLNRSGAYQSAAIFGAPGELRVALGPAGSSNIELIDLSTGTASTTPVFVGAFHSWFLDGERFLTSTGLNVRVYLRSAAAAPGLFAVSSLEGLGGQGDFFWTNHSSGTLDVYEVAAGTTPTAFRYCVDGLAFASASHLACRTDFGTSAQVIDLTSGTPNSTEYALPGRLSGFSASPSGQWFAGTIFGTIYPKAELSSEVPRSLGCGRINDLAGANDGTIAVSTAGAGVLLAKVSGNVPSIVGRMPIASNGVELSSSGNTLVVATGEPKFDVFRLPGGTMFATWTSPTGSSLLDFWLARGGTHIGWAASASGSVREAVARLDDFQEELSLTMPVALAFPLILSPDGTKLAVSDGSSNPGVRIYDHGTLSAAVPGFPVIWLDDNRILVETYTFCFPCANPTTYTGSTIYDATGSQVSNFTSPTGLLTIYRGVSTYSNYAVAVSMLDASHVLNSVDHAVYDLTTGAKLWTSPSATPYTPATAASGKVVWQVSNRLVVETPTY